MGKILFVIGCAILLSATVGIASGTPVVGDSHIAPGCSYAPTPHVAACD